MAKTLELQFGTEFGKTASISVDNPKEPIDEEAVKYQSNYLDSAWHATFLTRKNPHKSEGRRIRSIKMELFYNISS